MDMDKKRIWIRRGIGIYRMREIGKDIMNDKWRDIGELETYGDMKIGRYMERYGDMWRGIHGERLIDRERWIGIGIGISRMMGIVKDVMNDKWRYMGDI